MKIKAYKLEEIARLANYFINEHLDCDWLTVLQKEATKIIELAQNGHHLREILIDEMPF